MALEQFNYLSVKDIIRNKTFHFYLKIYSMVLNMHIQYALF